MARTVTTGSIQFVTTGWTQASTLVTVDFTSGWNLGIDDITYRPPTNPAFLSITVPQEGLTITGTTVDVTYAVSGDLTGADHAHFRLDGNPVVMDLDFDGVYRFTNVPVGSHVLTGVIARADHSEIAGSEDTVAFTTVSDPSDPVQPTVAITAPTDGSTVSDTTIISAEATDNVGIAGVQFFRDGTPLAPDDTAPPYSLAWNTTMVGNGSYTLTARARDTAGNEATSAPITVSVANVPANDPSRIGQWSTRFSLPIVAVNMVLLHTGQVLMWDGDSFGGDARLWNPALGSFMSIPNDFTNLFCSGQITLPDGRALVLGGHEGGFIGVRDANIFDPLTETWQLAAPMAFPRWYPTATTLPDGRVLVVSGSTTCSTCIADTPEIYDPATNTWTQLSGARLTMPLYPFMFVLPDGRVLYAGSNEANTTTQALDLTTQRWTVVDPVVVPGGSAAMYRPGIVMKAGSPGNVDLPPTAASNSAYVIDLNQPNPAWRQVGSMGFPRAYHTLTMLPDGNVVVTGGVQTTDEVSAPGAYATELWNAQTETWTTMAAMQTRRSYHSTALLLPDGRVLVAGSGRFAPMANELNAEIFSPPYLFRGPRPTITSAPSLVSYDAAFSVETPNGADIESVALVRLGAVTHGVDMDQRYVPLSFGSAVGGLTVRAPASPNLAPPGYYMLFLVNTAGVPSVAAFVRLSGAGDTQAPSVTITAPTPDPTFTTSSSALDLGGTAADNVGVTQVTWANDRGGSGTATSTPPNWSVSGIVLQPGANVLTVTARDAVGNSGTDTLTVTYTPPGNGLVAAYSFNQGAGTTVTDVSGNGRTGTIAGATWTTQGRYGGALSFDGVNDWVTVNDAASLDLTTGMTITAWVYPTVSPTGWRTVVAKEGTSPVIAYFLHASSSGANQPAMGARIGGVEQQLKGGTRLAANAWTHLASTYDGATLRLYVNGVQVASRAQTGAAVATNNPLRIGGNGVWGEFFQGRIDEVRIYNRARSQAEIQSDMNTPLSP